MKKLVTKIVCDICSDEWTVSESEFKNKATTCLVKCLTEQNEGRAVSPYFETRALDICETCKSKLLEVYPLTSVGAMGYNDYKIKS